jgi:ABC-2 type transport system ATP-binding protein
MDFAEKMCDHIAMIDHGKIILKGSLKEVKSNFAQRNVSLNYEGDISFLQNNPIIEKIENFGNTTGIRLKESSQTQDLLRMLVEKNVIVKKFDANDISLHEILFELAGSESLSTTGKEVRNANTKEFLQS